MLVGPVFSREVVTLPRRLRLYYSRSIYVGALLLLMCTAWLVLTGTQIVRNVGDLARFGTILFQILAPLQLALALLFSALLGASSVAQEKDRRTLVLLLLTNLSNGELVLGKLLASLLSVLVMLAAAVPLFMISALLGGISFTQIGRVVAVTLAGVVAAGSLGSTIAFWREKTFPTLATTALALVFYLAVWEIVGAGLLGDSVVGVPAASLAASFSPWQAILLATEPTMEVEAGLGAGALQSPVHVYLVVALAISVLLNTVAIARVRVWNPTRELQPREDEEERGATTLAGEGVSAGEAGVPPSATFLPSDIRRKTRRVWNNPVLWREICTWAYGRKVLFVRAGYLLLFAATAATLYATVSGAAENPQADAGTIVSAEAKPVIALVVLSLVLVNALSVTSLTTERDGRALDLLLVSDLTPKEFVFGKLGGVFFNTKEMILLPMTLCLYLWISGYLSGENLGYLIGGLMVMNTFVAMVGIHLGMAYENSRSAIGVSLGTVLFLFFGIATCMRMMIAFSGSFHYQLQPFVAFMIGGGVGLFVALGSRNPSRAIGLASFLAPFATFYVITSFIIGYPFAVFSVTVATYGFATAAMLIPAIYEFDVATGRTTSE